MWPFNKIPECSDGQEVRNAVWHGIFSVLAFGSFVFHLNSVFTHLRRDRENKRAVR